MKAWVFAALAAFWLGQAAAEVSTLFSVVMIDGQIRSGDHAALVKEIEARKPRHLLLGSIGGGDAAEAERIGDEIARRRLPVKLAGICVSPCAEHIFLRAVQREMGSNAFLLITPLLAATMLEHGEAAAAAEKASLVNADAIQGIRETLQRDARLRETLIATGIAPALFEFRKSLLSAEMKSLLAAEGEAQVTLDINLPTRCIAWAPRASVLRELGVEVKANRDARLKDFPRLKEVPAARVFDGPPLPAEAMSSLCAEGG